MLASAGVMVDGNDPWDIQVVDQRFFRAVLTQGSLGLGEAYMNGWWTCNDLEELSYRLMRSRLYKASLLLPRPVAASLLHATVNQQSKEKSLRVAVRHYSLGNDIFLNFLGRHHSYSCGYFLDTDDLDVAQGLKLEKACRLLDLRPGDRVLDVGGGWGEFARYAATHYGCQVTSINIADEQIKFAKEYCKDTSVEVRRCDYRDLTGRFDKIVVMAMLTHVGPKNYRHFMEIMHRCLEPGGTMLIESVGGHKSMKDCEPWIDRYIFPGGVVPSLKQFDGAFAGLFSRKFLDEFGSSYVKTLRAWNRNFVEAWPTLQHRYDDRVRLMFEYFFQTVAGSFRAGYLLHWHILLQKVDQADG
jgi:cyclopropane-fatty-acyl-phospholipid synthase